MKTENKNILGYVRVSTQEQTENFSINNQKNDIKDKCRKENWNLIDIYSDEGITGTNIESRQGLKNMLEYIKNNGENIDGVLIWKLSRISRKVGDLAIILDTLEKYDVSLISIMDNVDTSSSMGKAFIYIAGVLAEMERDSMMIQLKGGMKQRALEGKFNGGVVPIGYNYNKGDDYLTLNEKEAVIVKKIFELYVEKDYGYKRIAQWLNARLNTYPTKRGTSWSIGTVKGVIDNPVYIGKLRWGVHKDWSKKRRKGTSNKYILVDSKHEPIITNELWEASQNKRKLSNKKISKGTSTHLLSGILKCPVCGASMVSHKIKKRNKSGYHRYYICSRYANKGIDVCGTNLIKAEEAEKLIISKIKGFIGQDDTICKLKEYINLENRDTYSLEENLKRLCKEISKLENKHDKYYEYLVDEEKLKVLSEEKLFSMIEQTRKEIEILTKEKEQLLLEINVYKQNELDLDKVMIILKNFDILFNKANDEERIKLINVLVKEIKVNQSKDINKRVIKEIVLHIGELILFMENTKDNLYLERYDTANLTINNF